MVRLYLWAGCCEAPPTSTATGNPITFCSIRLWVRPSSGTSAGVRSPVVRTGQRCRLVILWFRPECTAVFVSSQLSRARPGRKISHRICKNVVSGRRDPSSRRHEWPARIAPQMLHARSFPPRLTGSCPLNGNRLRNRHSFSRQRCLNLHNWFDNLACAVARHENQQGRCG